MAVGPGTLGRRYAPFLALAAVQVLLVAIVPSRQASDNQFSAAAGPATGATSGPVVEGATVERTASTVASASVTRGTSRSQTGRGASPSAATSAIQDSSSGAPSAGGSTEAQQDLSNCDENGRQIGPTYFMPTCAPVWHGGDNGGSTMTGVSGTQIRYIFYEAKSDPQVNAILKTQGLAASETDHCAAFAAFDKEINKRWEFYGRKMVPVDGPGANKGSAASGCDTHYPHFQGQCSLTPPDPPCERAEARQIASMNIAYVIAPVADPAFYNELAKHHVMVAGGEWEPATYHRAVAPYYWDVFRDGELAMTQVAEYYCKKLVDKPPKFAGLDVRTATKRKLGLTYPATNGDPTYKVGADLFIELVTGGMCGSSDDSVVVQPYQSDITTAQQQARTTASKFKSEGVTTVVCFCDPIAPAFLTNAMDSQNYHPEHLLTGTGLLDYDLLGRLYSPTQWSHAFGPSELFNPPSFSQSDAAKAWHDAGNSGDPDGTENLNWAYFSLLATSFQVAGPQPTPDNIRNGLFRAPVRGGWEESGHNPQYPLIKFGARADDYTGIEDAREVYWSNSARSSIDGRPGAYVAVDGGRRYTSGQWGTGDPQIPVPPS